VSREIKWTDVEIRVDPAAPDSDCAGIFAIDREGIRGVHTYSNAIENCEPLTLDGVRIALESVRKQLHSIRPLLSEGIMVMHPSSYERFRTWTLGQQWDAWLASVEERMGIS
jgi:hypothetical protein